jgi:hypothetical protein
VTARVVLTDAEPNGLAEMLARLLESNLACRPGRSALLRPATVELEAVDANVEVTVRVRRDSIEIANGRANPGRDLRIGAPSQELLALAAAPLVLGLPDPSRRDGRAVLAALVRRRVRISGLLRHPVMLARFARLLSVRG